VNTRGAAQLGVGVNEIDGAKDRPVSSSLFRASLGMGQYTGGGVAFYLYG